MLDRADALKREPHASRALEGRTVALLFEKPSTRTRVSFQAGIHELGGFPMMLGQGELQLARGESIRDTALVLSRHVAAIGVRTGPDAPLEELAAHAKVPVFNMLTAGHHPCQSLADLMTMREAFGSSSGGAQPTPSIHIADLPCVNEAIDSIQLKPATPGGAQVVSSF